MSYYFDASALVKAFCEERGSGAVIDILNSSLPIYSSIIIYPEVIFALRRKREREEIEESEFYGQILKLESRWGFFNIIDIHVFWSLKDRVIRYPLKAIDAIHLASALWLRDNVSRDCEFVCSDEELIKFAREEGLRIINPQEMS